MSPLSRGDGSEMLVGRGSVPKTGQKNALPRENATEVLVGRVPVPKTGQKPPSPRRDASGIPVGRVAVPKTGRRLAEDLSKSRQLTRTGAFQARHCR